MNAPTLPSGFLARSATLDDAEIAAQLFKIYSLATAGVEDINAKETRDIWQSPRFNLATDTHLVFAQDGRLAAYVETWVNSELPVHPFVWACVHPDFTGKGLGAYLTTWAENRCRQVFDAVPADLRVAVRSVTFSTNQPAHQLLSDLNWKHIRSHFIMRIDMNAAPEKPNWPIGIELRPYESKHLCEVYAAHREAFQDHFGYVDVPFESGLAQFKHQLEDDSLFDPSLWFVAWDGNEIAGYCLCRASSMSDHAAGYVSVLGVRRKWRKHGLGRALLLHAFDKFYRCGQMHVELGVDAMNLTGALRLYEKVGMHAHRQYDMFEKELRPGREVAVESL